MCIYVFSMTWHTRDQLAVPTKEMSVKTTRTRGQLFFLLPCFRTAQRSPTSIWKIHIYIHTPTDQQECCVIGCQANNAHFLSKVLEITIRKCNPHIESGIHLRDLKSSKSLQYAKRRISYT